MMFVASFVRLIFPIVSIPKRGVGKTRDGRTSVTIKMGKTRDIYVTDPWQISVRMDRLQRAIIRDGWRLIFSLKTEVFAEIRDALPIIRDGWGET